MRKRLVPRAYGFQQPRNIPRASILVIRYSSLASDLRNRLHLAGIATEIAPSSIDIASRHETTGHFALGRNDKDDAAGAFALALEPRKSRKKRKNCRGVVGGDQLL